MSDIELVIKLDEELYNYMQKGEYDNHLDKRFDYQIRFAVKNGTPLPKGHGDLIDRKDLIENGIHKGFCDWYDEIKMADAIIEADTKSRE